MAWNKSSENGEAVSRPLQNRKGFRFPIRRAIAGAVVVVVFAAACFFLIFGVKDKPNAKPGVNAVRVKDVTSAKSNAVIETRAPERNDKDPHAGMRLSSNGVWQPADRPYRAGATKVHGVVTNRIHRRPGQGVATTSAEQTLLSLFSKARGEMPPPRPRLSQRDRDRLVEILISKTPVSKDDSEAVKMSKETLAAAKSAMIAFVKDGGEPEDFLDHYYNELDKCFRMRKDLERQIKKFVHEGGSREDASIMFERMNESLEEKGILPLNNVYEERKKP